MALYGTSVEYGLHCLLHLSDAPDRAPPSAKDLAEYQGISPSFVAKLFTKLEKAGLVISAEGVRGGFRLARSKGDISVLQVVDALEGGQPLFKCREIRGNCILYGGKPPDRVTSSVCQIHALMQEAELKMRGVLAARSLADLDKSVGRVVPAQIKQASRDWFDSRAQARRTGS
ncbi:MAG: Rrf2 family transcriptional regulator [Rhodospirillales bacterium]|jgi:Rrf2 family protein